MKERDFYKVDKQRLICKNKFLKLNDTLKSINDLLNVKILNNNGWDLCHFPAVYITKRRKELLKESIESMCKFEVAVFKEVKFKFELLSDVKFLCANVDSVKDERTLFILIKNFKKFYNKLKSYNNEIKFNDTELSKDKILDFLSYVIDVLKLEEQYISTKSVHDSDIDTDSVGYYQFDGHLRKQINDIFDPNSSWEPKTEDIKQGQFADCYLLSALLSVIKKDKNSIKKCFFSQTKNTIKLRFFKVKISVKLKKDLKSSGYQATSMGKVIIEIQKSILKNNGLVGNNTNALWVNIFEKAATIYKATNENVVADDLYSQKNIIDRWKNSSPRGNISVNNLNWGYGFIFLTAITGKPSSLRNIFTPDAEVDSDRGNYNRFAENLYEYFEKKLKNGKEILASTRDHNDASNRSANAALGDAKNTQKDYPGIMYRHVYSVASVISENGSKYIVLQNPYMEDEVDYRNLTIEKSSVNKNGKLVMELNDFIKCFSSYEICSKKSKK